MGEGGGFTFLNIKLVTGYLSGNFISKIAGQVGGGKLGVIDREVTVYWKKVHGETESGIMDGGEEEEESNFNTLCIPSTFLSALYAQGRCFFAEEETEA